MNQLHAFLARVAGFFLAGLAFATLPATAAAADTGEFRPRPETYICPNASAFGVDCFLDAVEHLYTMCRQVKSIEIIEFGYQQAEEGVNGAKSEYCIDKHTLSIAKPYQAALKQASGSRLALDGIRALHDLWLQALHDLKWHPPETDDEYKGRVTHPYDVFRERAALVRTALAERATPKSQNRKPAPAHTTAAAVRAN